jgi:hypothetical protein
MVSFALTLVLSCFVPGVASAQTPQGEPPPSFGPNAAAGPGGAIEGYQVHRFRDWDIQVTAFVKAAELRALLPAGYSLPDPNATTATVTLIFLFQERTELVATMGGLGPGTYPTAEGMTALTFALNPSGVREFVVLTNERPTEASTNLDLAIFGPGTARHASLVKVELAASKNVITFKGEVASGKLWAKVEVTTSVEKLDEPFLRGFLAPFSFRQLDNRAHPPAASARLTTGSAADQISVPRKNVKLLVKNNLLKLPGGTLTVVGVRDARIDRWFELFQKVSPP